MPGFGGFPPETISFLLELRGNNRNDLARAVHG
jgi:hypothetical protein